MYRLILQTGAEQVIESFEQHNIFDDFILFKFDSGKKLIVNKSQVLCIIEL